MTTAGNFYPRPPRGGRQIQSELRDRRDRFLSTPSARRATCDSNNARCCKDISIHALREEGDAGRLADHRPRYHFYPRPPRGGRRKIWQFVAKSFEFLSTPSARRATAPVEIAQQIPDISIHALREEGDSCRAFFMTATTNFYPRPPRGGRRRGTGERAGRNIFLSTPSARRATNCLTQPSFTLRFLSTPSARRATRFNRFMDWTTPISIHALREEGDGYGKDRLARLKQFLSTPSARRATAKTERKPSAFVSLYTSLHKLQRGAFKTNRKITPLLAQTAVIPVRSVQKNHVRFLFALAGYHPDIKRAAHYPVQTPGAVQRARPWSGNCCPAGRTADCPRQGRSGRSALP